nr:hypothetical protein HmN_000122300 [Hymenolepis microstoma]
MLNTMRETSKLVDEKAANSWARPSNHSESIASAPVGVSVEGGDLQEAVTPVESECTSVSENNGSSLEKEEILTASAQNPVSANSSIARDCIGDDDDSSPGPGDGGANEEPTAIAAVVSSKNNEVVKSGGGPQSYIGQGVLAMPEHGIVETEPVWYNGAWLAQVLVGDDLSCLDANSNLSRLSLAIPVSMLGLFCGKKGIHVKTLKERFQANVLVSSCDSNTTIVRLEVSCPPKFKEAVIRWMLRRTESAPSTSKIGDPTKLVRKLPLGELTRVYVRSWYSQKHLFVTIVDRSYEEFRKMEKEMSADYANNRARLWLYEPVFATSIAVLRTGTVYSRVCILDVMEGNRKCAVCFLLDHGTFAVASITDLFKIKVRYMRTPFQAVSVMWAHAQSAPVDIPDDYLLRRYFNNDSLYVFPVRNETCCRSDVIFFNRIEDPKQNSQYLYQDILVQAANEGYCRFAGKIINLNEQFELNGCEKAYYFCPYSSVYEDLVCYRMPNGEVVRALDVPVPRPSPQPENEQQHQQDQLVDMQRQQRQSAN